MCFFRGPILQRAQSNFCYWFFLKIKTGGNRMHELWDVILTSTVVATVISGIVSIIVSYMQYNSSLKLNKNSRRWDLSIEVFKNLQNALERIENTAKLCSDNSDKWDDQATESIIVMFKRSKEMMEVLKSILDQIAYLLPEKRVNYYREEHSKLEKSYMVLLASAYQIKGVQLWKNNFDIVSPKELPSQIQKYIDDTQKFSDDLKNEIIISLRKLCN